VAVILNQGPTHNCGEYAILQACADRGKSISLDVLYTQMHGVPLPAGGDGDLTSFEQMQTGIKAASQMAGLRLTLYNGDGYVYDLLTFDQLVRDGWMLIPGLAMQYVIPGNGYGHYLLVPSQDGIDFYGGVPYVNIEDTYHLYDGDGSRLPLASLHAGMAANWTGPTGQDAIAWKWE